MAHVTRPRKVDFDELVAPDYPPSSASQRLLAAEIRPEAVHALLRLHPVIVAADETGRWRVVGGLRSYRLARAVLNKGKRDRLPVIQVDTNVAAFLSRVDDLLTPVLADDLPAYRRGQWTALPEKQGHRLVRAGGWEEAMAMFQAPPARTERVPPPETPT